MDYVKTVVLLSLLYYTGADINMEGPMTHTAMLGSDSQVPCKFTSSEDITNPEQFFVTWYNFTNAILSFDGSVEYDQSKYSMNVTQALGGTADLTIHNISIEDAGDYKCAVSYQAARSERTIHVNVKAPPQITIINNAVMMHHVSFLCCGISRFYPKDINITWFRDGENQKNVLEGKPRENSDGTYSVNSSLLLTPTEEDRGRNFSCTVEHVSLHRPLNKDLLLIYEDEKEFQCKNKVLYVVDGLLCAGFLVLLIIWKKTITSKTRRREEQTQEQIPMNIQSAEGEDNPHSSEMERNEEDELSNLDETEAEDPNKPPPHPSYTEEVAEDSSSQTDENNKENQNPEGEKLGKSGDQ